MPLELSLHHPTYGLKSTIQEIANPLFKGLGFSYFQYLRCFADGSIGLLTNNTSLIELFDEIGRAPAVYSSFQAEHHQQHAYWFLWDEELPASPVQMVRNKCNVRCGITLVKRYKNYYDMLAVALSHDEVQAGFYLNKLKPIEQFFSQFEKEHQDLIQLMNNNPISLPIINRDVNYQKICLKNERINIAGNKGQTYLTAQEIACLRLIHEGCSYKETAQRLGISHRTVETYLQRVKDRTALDVQQAIERLMFSLVDSNN
jgi:DNA-binding CsgD family transcriptional regulator